MAANAALAPQSSAYVADLLAQVASAGSWINTLSYSAPVFTVRRGQRTVIVKLDDTGNPAGPALQRSWIAVPVPANARPAAGTDANMIIWQPSTGHMWEFWEMEHEADGWHAQWGGTIDNVPSNPGYYTYQSTWGATATSLPILGGLITTSELKAGHIDHAVAIAIPAARAAYFAWPAQRTDGYLWDQTAIPEGQRFRLDPHLNLRRVPMAPIIRMIAVAVQKYGMIVRDQAPTVAFYAEDTLAEGVADPYDGRSGYFEGKDVRTLLARFPWSRLEALKDNLSCCWHS